ncbi:MAG TPA: M28 family peptidase, partial [Bacteroidales bacterium]|nr:M28 family peptidase [Bacteroidales bacterium]
MIRTLLIPLFLLIIQALGAQDIRYARHLIDTLCSNTYYGRGYVNDGMANAAVLLAQEMERHGLRTAGPSYLQAFPIAVNTFPGLMEFRADSTFFTPGLHFVAAPFSPTTEGEYRLVFPDTTRLLNGTYRAPDPRSVVVIPEPGQSRNLRRMGDSLRYRNPYGGAGVVRLKEKISWHVSGSWPLKDYFLIDAVDSLWPERPDSIGVVIRSVAEPFYMVENVFGYIPGTRYPDRFILFTAHYDHLGMMGPYAIFPGANDNASGTAMIFDLARHYAAHPPEYSVGILACASEEAGLLGSRYFTEHPLIPLDKIEFVLNLDMVGTGSEGI